MGAQYSCPSSRPELGRSQVIGVVAADERGQRRVTFLPDPIPVTRQVRALDGPVALTEFLRFSSPCATTGCGHFRDGICGIARQVRRTVPAVTGELPACHIRATCRWYHQEGSEACARCPAVVTDTVVTVEQVRP